MILRTLSVLVLLGSAIASAATPELKAEFAGYALGARRAKTYALPEAPARVSVQEFAEAVGRAVRHSWHKRGYSIEAKSFSRSNLTDAERALSTPTAEYQVLSKRELGALASWIEDKKVRSVVVMNLELDYRGGTGLVEEWIFIPSEPYDPALVVTRTTYAE